MLFARNLGLMGLCVGCFLPLACDVAVRTGDDENGGACAVGDSEECTCTSGAEGTRVCDETTLTMGNCVCYEATMRFCHAINLGGEEVVFTVRIGEGDQEVVFESANSECDPPEGAPCRGIVSGMDIPISIEHEPTGFIEEGEMSINRGGEYIGYLELVEVPREENDTETEPLMAPTLNIGKLPSEESCDTYEWFVEADSDA